MQHLSLNQKSFVALAILIGAILVAPHVNGAPILPDSANIPKAGPRPVSPPPLPPTVDKEKLPELKPAIDENSAIKITVSEFKFTGNSSFSETRLAALLTDYLNRPLDIKELNRATRTITEFYRSRGFMLTQAYLPEQDIGQGPLEISIIEGTLGEVRLKLSPSLDEKFLNGVASNNLAPGDTIREDNLVKNVSILNSLPGLWAAAQLNPGEKLGTSDAEIELQELPRWSTTAYANTYGNQYTGREIVGGTLYLNNPAGRGDQAYLSLSSSRDELERNLQLGYVIPVHVSGTLLSLQYNYVDYKLDGEFSALDATGKSEFFGTFIDQPIVRASQKNMTARVGISYKDLTDDVGAFSLKNRRYISAIELGAYGDWRDNLQGFNQLGLNIRAGNVNFGNAQAELLDAATLETAGGFAKFNIFASRIQPLFTNYTLTLNAEYQGAGQNLDSSEQFSVGGINRWRAFAELPTSTDLGLQLGTELRYWARGINLAQMRYITGLSPYVFVDYGTGTLNKDPLIGDNHVDSVTYGLGIDANIDKNWLMGLTVSRQERHIDGNSREATTNVWGQVQVEF